MVGSKTWTLLDSLELLDHDAVLMPLEPLPGSAVATQSSQPADTNSDPASSSPGISQLCSAHPLDFAVKFPIAQMEVQEGPHGGTESTHTLLS